MRRTSPLLALALAGALCPLSGCDVGSTSDTRSEGGEGGGSGAGAPGGAGTGAGAGTTTNGGSAGSSSNGGSAGSSSNGGSAGSSSNGGSAGSSSNGGSAGSSSNGGAGGGGAGGGGAGGGGAGGGSVQPECPPGPEVITNFEEGVPLVLPAFGAGEGWYSYHDPSGGSTSLEVEDKDPEVMCDRRSLHATAQGHPNYVGFGVTLKPDPDKPEDPSKKGTVSFAAYQGVRFDIRADSAQPPIFFEVLNTETQPPEGSGTAAHFGVDAYNTRGVMLSDIGTSWKTVYVPFGLLAPRFLPSGCAAGVMCEAPGFNPASVLGFQLSVLDQFTSAGKYDVHVDNFEVLTDDSGVPAPPDSPGASYPFPRDSAVGSCGKVAVPGKLVTAVYDRWKSAFVTSSGAPAGALRVRRPENDDDSVSEGIAYGMLIAVYMNDRPLFDGLLAYWNAHQQGGAQPLMTWRIDKNGNVVWPDGTATDADEDAAFALLMAYQQWKDPAHQSAAGNMITAVWNKDIEPGSLALKPGSNFGGSSLTNPSYFAPAYYRAFAKADPGHNWNGVLDTAYTYLNNIKNGGASLGLVPAWCQNNCNTPGGGGYPDADRYQYDSHRTPWRIGLDACWHDEPRAKSYVALLAAPGSGFFSMKAAAGLGSLGDVYTMSGNKDASAGPNSMSIIGMLGAGALAAGNAALAERVARYLLDATRSPDPKGASYSYYNATVGLLSLLTLTGNFNSFPAP